MRLLCTTSLTAIAATLLAGAASAATLTLDSATQDGFTLSPLQTSSSAHCPTPGDSCMLINNGGSSVLTYAGGAFDLAGFRFDLTGGSGSNSLVLTAAFLGGGTSTRTFNLAGGYDRGTAYDVSLPLTNLSSLTFGHSGGATARVDDIAVSAAAVPLPATALLLGTAALGLGAFGRRRRRAA